MVDARFVNANSKLTLIDANSKEQLLAIGYRQNYLKTVVFHCASLLCLGLPYVLAYWHKVFSIRWQYSFCSISNAQVLILEVNRIDKKKYPNNC